MSPSFFAYKLKIVGLASEDPLVHDEVDMDDVDSDVDESDSEDDSREEAQPTPSDKAIYNREAILEKLEDIAWPQKVDWMHKLTIDHDQGEKVDVNDDLARELAFYTQALEGTRQAFEKLQSMKVRFLRPTDYYAEMVKTDAHMHKIKGRLLSEKKKIEEAEERKKAREARKRAKEVQAEKKKERAKQKKEEIENVKKWRKQRQQGGFAKGNDDVPDLNFEGEGFKQSKKRGLVCLLVIGLVALLSVVTKERTGGQETLSLDTVVGKGLRSKTLLRRRMISEALARGASLKTRRERDLDVMTIFAAKVREAQAAGQSCDG
ncbi:hypothetical protein EJB05_56619, partial [Eragrostis curvula]